MKKIFMLLLLLLVFSLSEMNYINAGISISSDETNYKYEKKILDIERKLTKLNSNSTEYLTLEIQKIDTQKLIIINDINTLNSSYGENHCDRNRYCSLDTNTKALIKLYEEKITIKNNNISIKKKLLEEKIEKEEKAKQEKDAENRKIQKEEKIKLQLRIKKDRYNQYILKARKTEGEKKYKKALYHYKTACRAVKVYDCYYGIGKVSFTLGKQYFDKRNLYGYENLAKKTWKEAKENLDKALELSTNNIQKKDIELLIKLIDEYPSKEKDNTEKGNKKYNLKSKETEIKKVTPLKKTLSKKEKIEKKVNLILKRLNKITAKYSPDKKKKLYTKLITQLEKYKEKTRNTDLKSIIELLIIKLQEF